MSAIVATSDSSEEVVLHSSASRRGVSPALIWDKATNFVHLATRKIIERKTERRNVLNTRIEALEDEDERLAWGGVKPPYPEPPSSPLVSSFFVVFTVKELTLTGGKPLGKATGASCGGRISPLPPSNANSVFLENLEGNLRSSENNGIYKHLQC